jgi:hypothetical protein
MRPVQYSGRLQAHFAWGEGRNLRFRGRQKRTLRK